MRDQRDTVSLVNSLAPEYVAELRALLVASPTSVRAWVGAGWPRDWADMTGITDQEVVWPVREEGKTQDDEPMAVFLRPGDQRTYVLLRNAALPLLDEVERLRTLLVETEEELDRWEVRRLEWDHDKALVQGLREENAALWAAQLEGRRLEE